MNFLFFAPKNFEANSASSDVSSDHAATTSNGLTASLILRKSGSSLNARAKNPPDEKPESAWKEGLTAPFPLSTPATKTSPTRETFAREWASFTVMWSPRFGDTNATLYFFSISILRAKTDFNVFMPEAHFNTKRKLKSAPRIIA